MGDLVVSVAVRLLLRGNGGQSLWKDLSGFLLSLLGGDNFAREGFISFFLALQYRIHLRRKFIYLLLLVHILRSFESFNFGHKDCFMLGGGLGL